MLVIFSGGSGVGKNTIINRLLEESNKFELMPTYTTREKREGETEGKPYHFTDEKTFLEKKDAGEFYETNNVHGHYYGTSRLLYEEKAKAGKILLKDIDVVGTQALADTLGKETKIISIFLKVRSKEILEERLKQRHETEIEKRLSRYDFEQHFQNNYDYVITNDDLEKTISVCKAIIALEQMFLD